MTTNYNTDAYKNIMSDEKETVILMRRYDVNAQNVKTLTHSIVCEDSKQAMSVFRTLENTLNSDTARNASSYLKMIDLFFDDNDKHTHDRLFKNSRCRKTKQSLKSLLESQKVMLAYDFLNSDIHVVTTNQVVIDKVETEKATKSNVKTKKLVKA